MTETSTPAQTATECAHCRYTSGHTSWCPNGTGAPLVTAEEQAAVADAIAARDAEPELLTLARIIGAMRDDVTLNANPSIAMLGGNLRGTFDAANPGIVMTLNDGASEYDVEAEGPLDVLICRWAPEGADDDTEIELARGTASSVEDVLALYGTVVGRG